MHLSSGKFAVVEKSHEFPLSRGGRSSTANSAARLVGIVQGGSVSWQLGRQRLER
ncbi:DUF3363 domain-containing protein [Escherichia coli]|uniref:DUF3363 domain-containing protein n=1 Tax=Escherichia coli TaxID=562 RepID=UPI00388F7CAA